MQKKDRNQRRHLPGWCGPGRLSWRAPWGPGFSFVSSASVSSNSSSNVSFLNGVWIQSWFPVSVQHRRYYKRDDLVVVETSELSDQASQARKRKCRWSSTMNPSIHINLGLYYLVWLSLPSYTNLPGWLQAAGKGWLGIRNKKTLQPYESGKKKTLYLYSSGFLRRPQDLTKSPELIWRLPSKFQIIWDISSKFSGLLKKSELYSIEFKASM